MGTGVARLAAGLVAVNGYKSANHTVVAQLFTKQNPNMKAVVKDLTARKTANELVAASFVNKLNLPAPRSFLVFADPKDSFGSGGVAHASGQHLYLGSEFSNDKPFFTFLTIAHRWHCGRYVGAKIGDQF